MFDDGRIFPVFCVKKKDGQTMLFFCLRLEKGRWIEYHKRKTFIRERERSLVYNDPNIMKAMEMSYSKDKKRNTQNKESGSIKMLLHFDTKSTQSTKGAQVHKPKKSTKKK